MNIKLGLEEEYKKYKELNSKNGYSAGIVKWSEDIANYVEENVNKVIGLVDIIDKAINETDQGYTGFMYDCAIKGLVKFWIYGDDLLKWHNRKQYKDDIEKADKITKEGGQVSTSLFTLG